MSDATDPLVNLLAAANRARVRLWPRDGKIHHRSPEPMQPDLRAAILANKPALLAHLAVWAPSEASWLEWEADDLVAGLGVLGTDPVIQRAASLCAEAHYREDMAGVREGCALVEDRARKLAAKVIRPEVRAA